MEEPLRFSIFHVFLMTLNLPGFVFTSGANTYLPS